MHEPSPTPLKMRENACAHPSWPSPPQARPPAQTIKLSVYPPMLSPKWWLTNSLSPKLWLTKFVVPKTVTHKPSPFLYIYVEINTFGSTIMTRKFVVSEIMTHKARCPAHKQFKKRFRYILASYWLDSLLATKMLVIRRLVSFFSKRNGLHITATAVPSAHHWCTDVCTFPILMHSEMKHCNNTNKQNV